MKNDLTGRSVLAWLLGFFIVVAAVNAYFIYIAVATFRGEDEQKPYLQGVEYGETLWRRAEQARLGWRAVIGADRLATGKLRVEVVLKSADGRPQSKLGLVGELRHPTDETRDRQLRLVEIAAGEYRGELAGIHAGAWDVVVKTANGSAPFEATRRVWVP